MSRVRRFENMPLFLAVENPAGIGPKRLQRRIEALGFEVNITPAAA